MTNPTAAVVIIGNEILSGMIQDVNVSYIAKRLSTVGIKLVHVRIVPDVSAMIIDAVLSLKDTCDYLFTTGGIGPTHDDITTASIAKALNIPLELNIAVLDRIKTFFVGTGQLFSESMTKMAYLPVGSTLITNNISGSPGFIVENIHVMAGVPIIMQEMLERVICTLQHGPKILTKQIELAISENVIAADFEKLQDKYQLVEMGSYPFKSGDIYCTLLVLTSSNAAMLELAYSELCSLFYQFAAKNT